MMILSIVTFMTSTSVLMYEVAISRIFSVILDYHFTFLVVSIALMGSGIGGILSNKMHLASAYSKKLPLVMFGIAVTLPTSTLLVTTQPYFGTPIPYFVLASVPFLLPGMVLSTVFSATTTPVNQIYFFDLVGAASGGVAAIFLIDAINPLMTVLVMSLMILSGMVALTLLSKGKTRLTFLVMAMLLTVLLPNLFIGRTLNTPIGTDQGKEIATILGEPDSRIVDDRWTSFGKVDLVELTQDPHVKYIFTDGGAGTSMYHVQGNLSSTPDLKSLVYSTVSFPFYFGEKKDVLIIGPGGGKDVIVALAGGAERITAVEINPSIVDLVRTYDYYSGGIYSEYPNVEVVVEEGRSFVRRQSKLYDIIMLNIPITKTSEGTSGYALSENYLFTIESFSDYLGHLRPDGRLIIVAHERGELYRLVMTALEAFKQEGKSSREVMKQIAVIESPNHMPFPVLILKNEVFDPSELKDMQKQAISLGLKPIYLPGLMLEDKVLQALASGSLTPENLISIAPMDLSAKTDDSPFFYNSVRGLPETLTILLIGSLLVSMLVYSKSTMSSKTIKRGTKLGSLPLYFSLLGVGFMLLEVALTQKLILFIGNPTSAMAIVTSSLLASGGVGSLLSRRIQRKYPNLLKRVPLVITTIALAYALGLGTILDLFLASPLNTRITISVGLATFLGFFMGMPFPMGLTMLDEGNNLSMSWKWGLNGIFSVTGSVLAISLAMLSGFSTVLVLAGMLYVVVFLCSQHLLGTAKPIVRGTTHIMRH